MLPTCLNRWLRRYIPKLSSIQCTCETYCTVFEPPLLSAQLAHVILSFPVSSISGSIQVLGKGSKMLKVICTSTGGRPLTMSITGPSGYVENMTKIVNASVIKGWVMTIFQLKQIGEK